MALMRATQKVNQLIRSTNNGRTQALPVVILRHCFSTEIESQNPSSPNEPFLQQPPTGIVYGKLRNITMSTQKSDVISHLEDSKLTSDDIKVDYNRMFQPMAMLLQFPSISAYSAAQRTIYRKGRLFRLEKTDRQEWDRMMPYNGSYVLFQGIPRNALMDDVDRFLSGCNFDSSALDLFTRAWQPDPIRMAKVRFPSKIEAMNAVIRKNGAFCLNSRIVARILQ